MNDEDEKQLYEFDRTLELLYALMIKEKIAMQMFIAVSVFIICKSCLDSKLEKNKFTKKISDTYDLIRDYYES